MIRNLLAISMGLTLAWLAWFGASRMSWLDSGPSQAGATTASCPRPDRTAYDRVAVETALVLAKIRTLQRQQHDEAGAKRAMTRLKQLHERLVELSRRARQLDPLSEAQKRRLIARYTPPDVLAPPKSNTSATVDEDEPTRSDPSAGSGNKLLENLMDAMVGLDHVRDAPEISELMNDPRYGGMLRQILGQVPTK